MWNGYVRKNVRQIQTDIKGEDQIFLTFFLKISSSLYYSLLFGSPIRILTILHLKIIHYNELINMHGPKQGGRKSSSDEGKEEKKKLSCSVKEMWNIWQIQWLYGMTCTFQYRKPADKIASCKEEGMTRQNKSLKSPRSLIGSREEGPN